VNEPAKDDSISRVSEKTNLRFGEALCSLMFLLVRGCQPLGQPIEKPSSPRPSGAVAGGDLSLFQDAGAQVLQRREGQVG
jgi:hypothetical protein